VQFLETKPFVSAVLLNAKTGTSQKLNRHPHAAVHQNAAIFKLVWVFYRILWKFHDDTANVQELSRWQTDKQTYRHTHTNRHYWKQYHLHYAIAACARNKWWQAGMHQTDGQTYGGQWLMVPTMGQGIQINEWMNEWGNEWMRECMSAPHIESYHEGAACPQYARLYSSVFSLL